MSFTIEGSTGTWEIVCGLEVHAQVVSQAKLFSGAATAFGAAANTQVSPVDAGMPGMLPVVNGWCVEQAVRTGLGLRAQINRRLGVRAEELFLPGPALRLPDQPVPASRRRQGQAHHRFPRRHGQGRRHHPAASGDGRRQVAAREPCRRQPDRPQPLGRGADGDRLRARHRLARGGRPLPAQAALDPALPRHLRRQHGGGLAPLRRQRVRPQGRRQPARHALRGQERQLDALRRPGDRVRGEAAGRDPGSRRPYRPGDAPVRFHAAARPARCGPRRRRTTTATSPTPTSCRSSSPTASSSGSPRACRSCRTTRRHASSRDYGLSAYDAGVLVAEAATADYFEAVAKGRDAKQAANWVVNDLFGLLGKAGKGIEDSPVAAANLGKLLGPAQIRGDQRQDRQGRVRDHVRHRRRPRGDRRGARAASRSPTLARSSSWSTS